MKNLLEILQSASGMTYPLDSNSSYIEFYIKIPTHVAHVYYVYRSEGYKHDIFQPYNNLEFKGVYDENNVTFYASNEYESRYAEKYSKYEGLLVKSFDELCETFYEEVMTLFKTKMNTLDVTHEKADTSQYNYRKSEYVAYEYYINSISFSVSDYLAESYTKTLKQLGSSYYESSVCAYTNVLSYLVNAKEAVEAEVAAYMDANKEQLIQEKIIALKIEKEIQAMKEKNLEKAKLEILSAVHKLKDAKTLTLYINKDNIGFQCKIKNQLYSNQHYISSYQIINPSERTQFKTLFSDQDLVWDDIQAISYGKNVIYQKAE